MRPIILFDMNETLLDMSSLDPTFARLFGLPDGAQLRKQWFSQVLELFFTATITGEYRRFDALTDDALQMLAAQHGLEASADDRAMLKEAQGKIPAYPDVRPGLERLKQAGFRVATLTNSTAQSATRLLERAGLRESFDRVLSVDAIERYKPAREAYEYGAGAFDAGVGDVLLVAAHGWDIDGALAAGCEAAFVRRPGKVLNPGARQPRFDAGDVDTLARELVASCG